MNLSDLRAIVQNYGFLTQQGVAELSKHAPNTTVVIRFGYGPRVSTKVDEVEKTIRENTLQHKKDFGIDQYVRDVFIPSDSLDKICEVFGWLK